MNTLWKKQEEETRKIRLQGFYQLPFGQFFQIHACESKRDLHPHSLQSTQPIMVISCTDYEIKYEIVLVTGCVCHISELLFMLALDEHPAAWSVMLRFTVFFSAFLRCFCVHKAAVRGLL